jgi:hypothetical protein
MEVKKAILILFVIFIGVAGAFAQEKGVDRQSERIRDGGNGGSPANNGTKQDVGTGSGINFGKGRTVAPPPIANPYRFTARRDVIIQAVQNLMRDRKLILDEAASRPDEGILISQPYTFIKGAVVSESELGQYAEVPASGTRGWTRGRMTLIVEIQPIDGVHTNVSINAKIEGRTDGAAGAEWTTLKSLGSAEESFLSALIETITGSPPPGRTSITEQ